MAGKIFGLKYGVCFLHSDIFAYENLSNLYDSSAQAPQGYIHPMMELNPIVESKPITAPMMCRIFISIAYQRPIVCSSVEQFAPPSIVKINVRGQGVNGDDPRGKRLGHCIRVGASHGNQYLGDVVRYDHYGL